MGTYDRDSALVIDPTLVFSTYFGGGGQEGSSGLALDAAGNMYITGTSRSVNLAGTNIGSGLNSGVSAAYVTKDQPSRYAVVLYLYCRR